MSGIVTFAKSRPSPVWLRHLCGKALPSVAPDLILHADILTLQASEPLESCPPIRKTRQSSAAAELSSFIQESANHSTPIGRASWSGLVQSIFSSPSRRSSFPGSPKCVAPRRWAKNALCVCRS